MTTHFRLPLKGNKLGPHALREYPIGLGSEVDEYINLFMVGSDYAAADWVVTETNAGTNKISAQELGGSLEIITDTADNDSAEFQLSNDGGTTPAEHWALTTGKRLWFKARFKLDDVLQSDFMLGLAITDTTLIDAVTDGLYFLKVDGAAALTCVAEKDSTATSLAIDTLVNDTYVDVAFYWDGKNTVYAMQKRAGTENEAERWVERGTLKTNLPDNEQLAVSFALQAGEAAAKQLDIGYIHVAQER